MNASLRILLLSLGTGLLACGGPDIDDYPRELEQAYCAWQHACHMYEAVADCVDARRIDADPNYEYLLRAAAAGSVDYDRDAAGRCLDAIRGRGCGLDDPSPEVCDQVFVGQVGRNAPCMNSAECAGDAVCGFDPSCVDECCVGACRVFAAPLEIGAPCSAGSACVDGAYCASDPVTGVNTVCTAHVPAGGDCSFGQTCAENSQCDGSTCRVLTLRKPGQSCEGEFIRCEEPASCRYRGEGTPRICAVAPGLGAPCQPEYEQCDRVDAYCDPDSRLCTMLPGPGQACVNGYECLPYTDCVSHSEGFGDAEDPSECVYKADEGEPCGEVEGGYIECLGDLECLETRRCGFVPPPPGEGCPVP